ncbi:MAG: UDP-glucose 4-epimerase GalE [Proteobacteria bacterium]|nr:UDP-glucose 4-epimerase GalE [Pseudomonadota bacterium]
MDGSKVLVTGGLGYIGSHTCLELVEAGLQPVILDNLANSKLEVLDRLEELGGARPPFFRGDMGDPELLEAVFRQHRIGSVLHFAGLKAVGESTEQPLRYYANNVTGTLGLLEGMRKADVTRLVFSSSATVYGKPDQVPITESARLSPTNPYGRTKHMIEQILCDVAAADPGFSAMILRYFNPVGAHPSGLLGEDPLGVPQNLVPAIGRVARGSLDCLRVFGNDYPTQDGTAIRDYIHVEDLARGHIRALDAHQADRGVHVYNLGTGVGHSVLQVVETYREVSGQAIPWRFDARRPGDIPECWADPSKARQALGWKSTRGLRDMVADSWRWESGFSPAHGHAGNGDTQR